MLEQAADLIGTRQDGQFLFYPGAGKVLLAPRHIQRGQIQELHGGHERINALGGELAFLEQVELIVADGLEIELLGAAVEVSREIRDIMDIASLCGGREIAQFTICDLSAKAPAPPGRSLLTAGTEPDAALRAARMEISVFRFLPPPP